MENGQNLIGSGESKDSGRITITYCPANDSDRRNKLGPKKTDLYERLASDERLYVQSACCVGKCGQCATEFFASIGAPVLPDVWKDRDEKDNILIRMAERKDALRNPHYTMASGKTENEFIGDLEHKTMLNLSQYRKKEC